MEESDKNQARDRLSELPESLIFHIFWLLPMIDVVRTTILSKHWKNLWTTTPCLNFSFYNDMESVQVRNFINRALMLWEGMKIQKFKIDLRSIQDDPFFRDFDLWLHFALRKEVQELCVDYHCPCESEPYLVPQYLYSYSSLKVLSLIDCRLEVKGNVQWNQLKSLTIRFSHMGDDDDVINEVLCGSPQLEVFILTHYDCYYEHLSIQSSSLKRLSIEYYIFDLFFCGGEVTIWTPNLETLKILGVPYRKYSLMDVSSLTHVTLGFDNRCGSGDLLGEALRGIFPTIQHVENVTLSGDHCIKVLGDLIKEGLIPSSSNAKFLKLNYQCVEYEQILGVLEIFPKLEMLVLKVDLRYHYREHVRESLKFDANVPKSFLLHLRTIEITWDEDDNSMFPFIKILLKYASKLENMVIQVAPTCTTTEICGFGVAEIVENAKILPQCRVDFL